MCQIKYWQKHPAARPCFHPGASGALVPQIGVPVQEISGWMIVKKMLGYVWPKEKPAIRRRVVISVGLLIGAKV